MRAEHTAPCGQIRRGLGGWLWAGFFSLCVPAVAFGQPSGLVEFRVGDRSQVGLRLAESDRETVIMGRDGWLHAIRSNSASVRPIAGRYEPISAAELRNELRGEFGQRFEVIATANFLVVQPRGRGQTWPDLFEQSHRAFLDYMRKRGVSLRQGRFPMVAVVFPDSGSMYAEFARQGIDVSRVAGLYSNSSNRVMTHDGGHRSLVAATVRHEAAHQSAFNSGVHSRVNETPKWVSEGIGQMFEPESMSDPRGASRWTDRINQDSMRVLKQDLARHGPASFLEDVADLIRGDDAFHDPSRIERAYAVAWAMMFFLGERQPDRFRDILHFTATRPPFQAYPPGQRLIDFERTIGQDAGGFARQVLWMVESVR